MTHWWEGPEWANKKAMDFGDRPRLGPSVIIDGQRIYCGARQALRC